MYLLSTFCHRVLMRTVYLEAWRLLRKPKCLEVLCTLSLFLLPVLYNTSEIHTRERLAVMLAWFFFPPHFKSLTNVSHAIQMGLTQ